MSRHHFLEIDQLRVGLYIHVDLKWFQHPFAFSHFKIRSLEQIDTLRALGLKTVRFSPELSDGALPPRPTVATSVPVASTSPVADAVLEQFPEKERMIEEMRRRRQHAQEIEKRYVNTTHTIREIEKNLYSRPQETVRLTTELITRIADSFLSAPELSIEIMGDRSGDDEFYCHSLNVTMLSMMLARHMALPPDLANVLGMGALLHDVGLKEIPEKVARKSGAWSHAERNLYQMHTQYGVDIGKKLELPGAVLDIIRDHHELHDGSGYAGKSAENGIGLLTRVVSLANYYDNLCNPRQVSEALTPHEALSLMFAKQREKFDPKLLQLFIRCLGVHPPGTIVQLSNGAVGLVTTINTSSPMKPTLLIYDPDVPKDEAIIIDLAAEADVNIVKAVRASQLPPAICNYLNPRKRVSYYFDPQARQREAGLS